MHWIWEGITSKQPGRAKAVWFGAFPLCREKKFILWFVPLTHDDQQHLPAADTGSLLHFTQVSARVQRLKPRQVDGGVAVLGVGGVEVDAALHRFVVVLVGPVAWVQDHLDLRGFELRALHNVMHCCIRFIGLGKNKKNIFLKKHIRQQPWNDSSVVSEKKIRLQLLTEPTKTYGMRESTLSFISAMPFSLAALCCSPLSALNKNEGGTNNATTAELNQHLLCQQRTFISWRPPRTITTTSAN